MRTLSRSHSYHNYRRKAHALFCVLDGHGGNEAALFAAQELAQLLLDNDDFQSYVQLLLARKNKHTNDQQQRQLLEQALIRSFVELDRLLYEESWQEGSPPPTTYPGSTVVLVLLTPTFIVCANLGDSRCVLATSSSSAPTSVTVQPLSEDQTPVLPLEKARILKAGGTIEGGRVDGELAVSRALGDFEHKQMKVLLDYYYDDIDDGDALLEQAHGQKVSPVPEVRFHERHSSTDRFLVLACDGIWDVVSNQDCVEWIADLLHNTTGDVGLVCERILDRCLQQGSQDNMTIVIVLLGEAGRKMFGTA